MSALREILEATSGAEARLILSENALRVYKL